MLRFLKVLANNLKKGPAVDAFPAQEAWTPDRFRGRVTMDPEKCVGCGICRHVCAGRAIRIEPTEDGKGYNFTIWHNTCALCGMCRHFCPTRAITMTTDWHNAHTQDQTFDWAEHRFVSYLHCSSCGASMRMLPPDLAARTVEMIRKANTFPGLEDRLRGHGLLLLPPTDPATVRARIAVERPRWREMVEISGARIE